MSVYRLDKVFSPRSVAVVGASPRDKSPGHAVLKNLRAGGFAGDIYLVNPHYDAIEGIRAVKSYGDLPGAPDLAVIAVPPPAVAPTIAAAGAKGTGAAIILTSGLGHGPGSLAETCERAARATGLRLVGPNCLGVLVPAVKLNASFAASLPRAGDLALISQSGAIASGLVAWGAVRGVGFSGVVSIGDSIDVDFADLLDHFALDRATRAILLYIESIKDARKFMSAARAAARAKPVLVVKSGRHAQGAKAAMTHTGALAGSDAVYDAAFRRAGLLRVLDLDELFAAAETLGHLTGLAGNRLAILTNGGGIGVLAVDRLADFGGELASISPATMAKLDAALPPIWSHANPADISGDADDERYAVALENLLADDTNDAVLVMNVPTALASPLAAAKAVIAGTERHRKERHPAKPVFAVWIGGSDAATEAFDAAKIPSYATESDAVGGFMHLVRYRQSHEQLMAAPPSMPEGFSPDRAAVRPIIDGALADKRTWLDPVEMTKLFSAYGIAITAAVLARDADEAVAAAKPHLAAGHAIVLKIQSPDIVHKSEVGGVRLNLISEADVRQAAAEILERAKAALPKARISGVAVFPMIVRPKARELIVGLADDPTFGPVIGFGQGGTAVEVISDKALALPPLDLALARDLIGRTRVSRILKAYRNVPAADERAIALLLVKLSQLAADFAEIREIDLNPVLADETGVIAVDARVSVGPAKPHRGGPAGRFAIRPYPKEWERHLTLPDGQKLLARPVRPEDESLYPPFFAQVTQQDLRLRFFALVKDFSHGFIARFTQIDYARAMAFIAIDETNRDMLGVVRIHVDPNYETAEYAILVRSDLKGHGLGWTLMELIIEYARTEGLRAIRGQVLRENVTMLAMCRKLGFTVTADPQDPSVAVVNLPV
ncbi:MAG TPA: bifunctional acetate--CoA ligase family protein/GNAT family N-acetyltransferase [Xanthobacteraceae bacterium]|jgi:acetyltransferase|nr:bifunctional acetate--CoA ligase family protein/GNAT family N-acetyltransferase [Xanthobacteraceae bacterium]